MICIIKHHLLYTFSLIFCHLKRYIFSEGILYFILFFYGDDVRRFLFFRLFSIYNKFYILYRQQVLIFFSFIHIHISHSSPFQIELESYSYCYDEYARIKVRPTRDYMLLNWFEFKRWNFIEANAQIVKYQIQSWSRLQGHNASNCK